MLRLGDSLTFMFFFSSHRSPCVVPLDPPPPPPSPSHCVSIPRTVTGTQHAISRAKDLELEKWRKGGQMTIN